jgi:DnaJ-class molecular chaperone
MKGYRLCKKCAGWGSPFNGLSRHYCVACDGYGFTRIQRKAALAQVKGPSMSFVCRRVV